MGYEHKPLTRKCGNRALVGIEQLREQKTNRKKALEELKGYLSEVIDRMKRN